MQRIILPSLTIFSIANLVGWVLASSEVRPALEQVIMPFIFSLTIGVIALSAIISLIASAIAQKRKPLTTHNDNPLPNIVYLMVAAILALVIANMITDATKNGLWWLLFWLVLSLGATSLCFFIVRATLKSSGAWILNLDVFAPEEMVSKETLMSFAAMNSLALIVLWNQIFLLLAYTTILLLLFLAWSVRKNMPQRRA